MSKKELEIKLKQNNIESINKKIKCIIIDDKIKFKLDNIVNIMDINNLILKRINEDSIINIDFNNEKIIYEISSKKLESEIKITKKITQDQQIYIEYQIEQEKFQFELKWR